MAGPRLSGFTIAPSLAQRHAPQMPGALPTDLPIKPFSTSAAFEKWIAAHLADKGLWLKIAKKKSGIKSVSYPEAVDVALCYGWIDGQKRSFDELYYLQRFTPRRARSLWSKVNVAKVAKLVEASRMMPPGQAEVDRAKADGRWQAAYDGSSTMGVPPELETALAGNPKAKAFFDTLNKTNRYAVCWRVQTARKATTRAARIDKLLGMLERGEKLH